jgi:MarR family transcriptional regulator, lower aerobic nicotinate degradation pathway regulator
MNRIVAPKRSVKPARPSYVLDDQIGFILRQVSQRHAVIFARDIGADLTPTQWAALSKLVEVGPCSQNQLGRLTAMDVATIKGVIDRLTARGLTETSADPRRSATNGEGRGECAGDFEGNVGAARSTRARAAGRVA